MSLTLFGIVSRLAKATDNFTKYARDHIQAPATQYLYSCETMRIHGFTCGGWHLWERMDPIKCGKADLRVGPFPLPGTVRGEKDGFLVSPKGDNFSFDHGRAHNRVVVPHLSQYWMHHGIYSVNRESLEDDPNPYLLYNDADNWIIRTNNGHDKCRIHGEPFPLSGPLTQINNLYMYLPEGFTCYTTMRISEDAPPMMFWSDDTVSMCVANNAPNLDEALIDGDTFNAKVNKKGIVTINLKSTKERNKMNIKIPRTPAPEDKELRKTPEQIADDIVQPTTDAPQWEKKSATEIAAEKAKNVTKSETKNVETISEKETKNVTEPPSETPKNVTAETEQPQEQTLSDMLEDLEKFAEERVTAAAENLSDAKEFHRAVKAMKKRVLKELKGAANNEELRAAQKENKELREEKKKLIAAVNALKALGGVLNETK